MPRKCFPWFTGLLRSRKDILFETCSGALVHGWLSSAECDLALVVLQCIHRLMRGGAEYGSGWGVGNFFLKTL
jgi:hypothetical protein